MRTEVAVVKNAFSPQHEPVALYLNGVFARIESATLARAVAGVGKCYVCRMPGRSFRLWQRHDADSWYIEE